MSLPFLPGLQANSLELLNLSVGQGPEGGDNEGRNLLRWLHPGADSQTLELSSGWLSEWENGDSGNPDFSSLNWVDNDGHQDWADLSWVQLSQALQGIDSNGPASLNHGDLGDRGIDWDNELNLLDKCLECLQVAGLAQSKDGGHADVLRFGPLNFLNKEWDELLSQNWGFLGSENTKDLGWEVVPHGGWVDVSMVEQVRQLEEGSSVQLLV